MQSAVSLNISRVHEIVVSVGKFQLDLRSLSANKMSWQPTLSFIPVGIVLNITPPMPCVLITDVTDVCSLL